jgi:hypothetical protein
MRVGKRGDLEIGGRKGKGKGKGKGKEKVLGSCQIERWLKW